MMGTLKVRHKATQTGFMVVPEEISKVLKSDTISDDIMAAAKQWAVDLTRITKTDWEAKLHERPSRMTVVVKTDDERYRFRERSNPKVARAIRKLTKKGRARKPK